MYIYASLDTHLLSYVTFLPFSLLIFRFCQSNWPHQLVMWLRRYTVSSLEYHSASSGQLGPTHRSIKSLMSSREPATITRQCWRERNQYSLKWKKWLKLSYTWSHRTHEYQPRPRLIERLYRYSRDAVMWLWNWNYVEKNWLNYQI